MEKGLGNEPGLALHSSSFSLSGCSSNHVLYFHTCFSSMLSPLVLSHNTDKYFLQDFIFLISDLTWLTHIKELHLLLWSVFHSLMRFPNELGSWCVIPLKSENHLLVMLAVSPFFLDLESEWLCVGDRDVDKCIPSRHQLSAFCQQGGKEVYIFCVTVICHCMNHACGISAHVALAEYAGSCH